MKINILFSVLFLSVIVYASADFFTGFVGATQLNGEGCICHSLTISPSVNVWIMGPDSIPKGETVQYAIFLEGGPSLFGGFNVAAKFGDLSPAGTLVTEVDDELTHSFPLGFPIGQPTSWAFNYTATTEGWDTLYSVGNSTDGNGTPVNDQWNFGPKFPIFITPPVPVELVSFNGQSRNNGILLKWITATEINNKGFEVERSSNNKDFFVIGFVDGSGTSTSQNSYSYFDESSTPGTYLYRLKQIDFDGSSEYSNIVSVDIAPVSFTLSQNYPNPFNPETTISFSLPEEGNLSLKIYNIQGELVEVLKDGFTLSGNHSLQWHAGSYTSGVYLYKIHFESKEGFKFSEARKMILAK